MLRARRMHFVDPETGEAYVQIVDAAVAEQLAEHLPHAHANARYVYPGEEAAADGDPYRKTRRPPRRSGGGGFWSATDGMMTPEEDALPDEDAFVALGKMVKGGAKFLWRKVSKSQKARDGAGEEDASGGEEGAVVAEKEDKAHPPPSMPQSTSAPASLNATRDVDGKEEKEEEEQGTLRIEFKEPRHCFEDATPAPPPLVPQSILMRSTPLQEVPAEKATQAPARGGADAGAGSVWEEAVDEDVAKRFEAVARAEKEKERGKGKLVAMLAARAPVKVGRRRESKEKLNKQDKPL